MLTLDPRPQEVLVSDIPTTSTAAPPTRPESLTAGAASGVTPGIELPGDEPPREELILRTREFMQPLKVDRTPHTRKAPRSEILPKDLVATLLGSAFFSQHPGPRTQDRRWYRFRPCPSTKGHPP